MEFCFNQKKAFRKLNKRMNEIMTKIEEVTAAAQAVSDKFDKLSADVQAVLVLLNDQVVNNPALQPAIDILTGTLAKEEALDTIVPDQPPTV
jgi:septal ring factor EnvC (AmiA/AmiB activator)